MEPGDVLEYAGRWASSADLVATVVAHGGAGSSAGDADWLDELLADRHDGDLADPFLD